MEEIVEKSIVVLNIQNLSIPFYLYREFTHAKWKNVIHAVILETCKARWWENKTIHPIK